MIAGVADTHTALWYLLKNPLLSTRARQFMDAAAASGNDIAISPISLAEIVYLIEKNRLPSANTYADLKAVLDDPDHMFKEAPFTVEIVDAMRQVARADVPDMPDRIASQRRPYISAFPSSAATVKSAPRTCRPSGKPLAAFRKRRRKEQQ